MFFEKIVRLVKRCHWRRYMTSLLQRTLKIPRFAFCNYFQKVLQPYIPSRARSEREERALGHRSNSKNLKWATCRKPHTPTFIAFLLTNFSKTVQKVLRRLRCLKIIKMLFFRPKANHLSNSYASSTPKIGPLLDFSRHSFFGRSPPSSQPLIPCIA